MSVKKTTEKKRGTKATKTTKTSKPRKKRVVGLNEQEKHLKLEEKAFEIYQGRVEKSIPGDALSDWIEAEQQLNF